MSVGVASFAEGVDLPDDYCRHVIIVKLPFAVPDDPLDEAMAEWLESQGRKPFFEISLPDAAMRLVQACGRLIRHEGDHGRDHAARSAHPDAALRTAAARRVAAVQPDLPVADDHWPVADVVPSPKYPELCLNAATSVIAVPAGTSVNLPSA